MKKTFQDKDSFVCCFIPHTAANKQYMWAPPDVIASLLPRRLLGPTREPALRFLATYFRFSRMQLDDILKCTYNHVYA